MSDPPAGYRESGPDRGDALMHGCTSGRLVTEAGPPAGLLEETRKVAQNHVIRLRGVLGKLHRCHHGSDPR
jgi:hypothetical protein